MDWKKTGNARKQVVFLGVVLGALCVCCCSWAETPRHSQLGEGDLFLEASLSRKEAYVEEQVLYVLRLFHRNAISDITLDLPRGEHIVFHQLGDPVRHETTYDGKAFNVIEVKYALLSSREGPCHIDPAKMNLSVSRADTSSSLGIPRDGSFFSSDQREPVTVASKPVELLVIPLPEEGRPAHFTGLVGQFSLESTLTPTSVRTGETAVLTVLIQGKGNVSRISDLPFPTIPGMKVYADQSSLEIRREPDGLEGTKGMKWALVPEREGAIILPLLEFSFFDPDSREYRSLRTASLSLTVLTSEDKGSLSAEAKRGEPVKQLGKDILPVHTKIEVLSSPNQEPQGLGLLLLLFFLPVALYVSASAALRYRRHSARNAAATRARKAASVLLKRFQRKPLSANDMALAIRDYLNDRFSLSMGSVTPTEASNILLAKGVSPAGADKISMILQRLEAQVYSGRGKDLCDGCEDLPVLIKGIERDLGGQA